MFKVEYSKQTVKDIVRLKETGLAAKAKKLVDVIQANPYQNPPPYEKLKGELYGAYSRRINKQHCLVYVVLEKENIIRILRMWTHYE